MRSLSAFLVLLVAVCAEDYISKIDCESGEMIVTMKQDSTLALASWAAPVNHTSSVGFSADGKLPVAGCSAIIAPGDMNATLILNFTACGVRVIQPQGGAAIVTIPLQAIVLLSGAIFKFTASCTYASHVTEEGGFTVTEPSGGGSGGDHGGGSGSTVKGLSAKWIYAFDSGAQQGDTISKTDVVNVGQKVAFVIEYTKDIYQRFLPITCYIADGSNMSDPSVQKIPFVVGACPASYPSWLNESLSAVVFSQEIKAIEFTREPYIYAYCDLKLCVDKANSDCLPDTGSSCWGSSANEFFALPSITSQLVGKASNDGGVYASFKIGTGGGGDKPVNGNGDKTTIVAATLGTLAGVLVIGLVVLLLAFSSRRKTVPAAFAAPAPQKGDDPAWANNFYKIPRAKPVTQPGPIMY